MNTGMIHIDGWALKHNFIVVCVRRWWYFRVYRVERMLLNLFCGGCTKTFSAPKSKLYRCSGTILVVDNLSSLLQGEG